VNKAVYLAIGFTLDGIKEVLGIWVVERVGRFCSETVQDVYVKRGAFQIVINISM
jgi:transposase-like protein